MPPRRPLRRVLSTLPPPRARPPRRQEPRSSARARRDCSTASPVSTRTQLKKIGVLDVGVAAMRVGIENWLPVARILGAAHAAVELRAFGDDEVLLHDVAVDARG